MDVPSQKKMVPSGKHTKKLWKDPPFFMGKSTISMAMFNSFLGKSTISMVIFNSYVNVYQRVVERIVVGICPATKQVTNHDQS